jgi:YD repeat-containing protein
LATSATAQTTTTYEEQSKLIRAPRAFASIGTDLFGDRVNLSNGTLQFVQTDVSLPGNNALEVSIGRRFVTGSAIVGSRAFGLWDIDIPHLHGIFSHKDGWSASMSKEARCTDFGAPRPVLGSNNLSTWDAAEFWQGSFLYTPRGGDQQMLKRSSQFTRSPGNVTDYPVVTTNFWSISCLPSLANPTANGFTGEGFVAVSPDGISYRFDWMATYQARTLQKPYDSTSMAGSTGDTPGGTISPSSGDATSTDPLLSGATLEPAVASQALLVRDEVWIMPTLVTDRFGNWVRYTYDPANPGSLQRIESSDGRVLTLTYMTSGALNRIYTINHDTTSHGRRTWTYHYGSMDLDSVTLPDGSAWQFGNSDNINLAVAYGPKTCDDPNPIDKTPYRWSMTHPSGATGEFTVAGTVHGRSDVPRACDSGTQWVPSIPRYYYTKALTTKVISGPGLGTLTWNYDYGPVNASWAPCDTSCIHSKVVSVTDPAGKVTRHTFGIRYNVSDGRLEEVNEDNLRITSTNYQPFGAGPYPDYVGYDDDITSAGDGGINLRLAPVNKRVITQQGSTFTWTASAFDEFARPTKVNRYSSLNPGRIEQTEYSDNFPKWILGQVKKVTETNTLKVMQEKTFDPTLATVLSIRNFGKLQQSFTYYADGTIKTVADEKNPATTFSNYKRGIAQRIDYPDGSYETAVVNDLGKIASLTNEVNATHTFGYDVMGRLSSILYPTADTVAWNQTTLTFSPVASQEYDLVAGHWKQTVTTGTATEVSYLDALWRPVYVERYDSADIANTSRIVKHQYDFAGRTTFDSYPKRIGQSTTDGVHSEYDGLGRLKTRSSDSELGTLYEYSYYLDGFQKQVVDARGFYTYYAYQAFDQPVEDAITAISAPESVGVNITRDVFGKTKSITRSGAGLTLTRSYVYDNYERLCKTIEPETGATIQDYDLANNVSWRATGLSLLSTTTCDTTSAPTAKKTGFTYDSRNRLKDTAFGDGSAGIYRTYTLDGQPETISSNGTKWTYTYNKRRLLEGESLAYGSATYSIGRTYDANGSLSQLKYPVDNLMVAYNPNALGEPRQVGNYATGITYYPSGAIAGFTYGNGIVHTMSQNVRGLPEIAVDAGVLSEKYAYDKNANVASITDQIAPGTATRGMGYDGLNRLKTTTAANLWGTATYGYDTLDNLVSTSITGGPNARTSTHNIDRTTNRLASITGGPANFNFAYGYDAQGNITSRGAQTYQFDVANRMTAAPGRATYVYDGLGRRASVVGTDGVNRIQVYSQAGQLLYVAPSGGGGTKYIYLHNHQIAEVK